MTQEFSFRTRQANLARLASETFDVLVIGGGITGAGIARDAAMRGLHVALVERGDFASGTSSKSTKLVHGGLRYLSTFDFGLVHESCRERYLVGRIASRLCEPLPLVYPCYGRTPLELLYRSAGMWLYDTLALFRNVRRHQILGPKRTRERLPGVRPQDLRGASVHYDLQTNDVWLTLATTLSAHRHGAVVASYVKATELRGSATLRECTLEDQMTAEAIHAKAQVIVNATGPWLDEVLQLDGADEEPRISPSKGTHLIIPHERLPLKAGVLWDYPKDGRTLVAVPCGHVSLLGTTELPPAGDWSATSVPEVDYLLKAANYIFPEADLTPDDVWSAFSGVRPLLRSERSSLTAASRTHAVIKSPSGMISIGGGKLTTYRAMAEEVVDLVVERIGKKAAPCRTAEEPLDGTDALPSAQEDGSVSSRLRKRYGPDAKAVDEALRGEPKLAKPIVPGLPYVLGEVGHCIQYEMALTLEDFLARRAPILYEDREHGLGALETVAHAMGEALGWDEVRRNEQIESYGRAVEQAIPRA